jgi:uncharacterized protein YprB with RNaseH-like and TPR domain
VRGDGRPTGRLCGDDRKGKAESGRETGVRVENSFIPVRGVGEATERSLWDAGITHWDDFEGDHVGPTRADRIEAFIENAEDALEARDVEFFDERLPSSERWRSFRSFSDRATAFDIETTGLDPDRSVVTTVTLQQDGNTQTLVRGDDLTEDALRMAFADADLLISFNGKSFDVPFLEQHFDVDLDRPHLDCMHVCRQAGLTGGLSAVERALGIERTLPDVDGREAVRLWRAHEAGRDGALEKLIRYNREDVTNLEPILDEVVDRLTPPELADANAEP